MNDDGASATGWALAVNKVVRGDRFSRPQLIVGPTPDLLSAHGLNSGALTMMVAKLAKCRRDHPEVSLSTLQSLPTLLQSPLAIFPSARGDGSVVSILMAMDADGNPVLVALTPSSGDLNAILSVYGKNDGFRWAARELARARAEGLTVYESEGFAASLPQPPAVNTASSSHGLIPSDGTAKPRRQILSLRKMSTEP